MLFCAAPGSEHYKIQFKFYIWHYKRCFTASHDHNTSIIYDEQALAKKKETES